MEFKIKGDYFAGSFNVNQKSDEVIQKHCPGDINHNLYHANVDYSHIDKVIESAITGYKIWRKLSLEERSQYLFKFQNEVAKREEDIAYAIALEAGKPLWEARTEASAVKGKVSVTLADSKKRILASSIPEIMPEITGHIFYKPIGPSLVIGPFNFPCHLANTQILAALLTGNTIIFKPSEKTVYSAQILIECFHAAGFPKGVINFINGTAHTTQSILKHPEIKAIFFTGSHYVGKKILEAVGTDVTKLVALELGGKNATIIHGDAHMEHTISELLRSCYLTAGQRCTSTSMLAVHRSLIDEFTQKFLDYSKKIIIGHPTKSPKEAFMGPLIDELAQNKYREACELGKQHGAEEILPLTFPDVGFQGYYVSPTIHLLKKAEKNNPFTQIEIFGPNCTIVPYDDIQEAIEIANISDYGLAAGVFTQDKNIYNLCLSEIDAGIINLNRSTVGAHARLPFGGVKNSGNYHPAAVSMIDHTVVTVSALETLDNSSRIKDVKGLANS